MQLHFPTVFVITEGLPRVYIVTGAIRWVLNKPENIVQVSHNPLYIDKWMKHFFEWGDITTTTYVCD